MNKILLLIVLLSSTVAYAGGPWSDQYCNATTETTVVKDSQGNIIDEYTIEKVVCDDGAKDFLAYSGIADNCKVFNYDIKLNGKLVPQRGFICERLDGVWEIVNPGDHRY
jgi:hypothetical protein